MDKSSKNDLVVVPTNNNEDGIKGFLVPCNTNEFGEFLSGLLKTPKTIRSRIKKPFVLRMNDLEDLFRILNQRIAEQQHHSIVVENISLFYNNGVSYEFGSFNEFKEHRELSESSCIKLIAAATYLVELPNSEVPQKQEIQLTFDASNRVEMSRATLEGIERVSFGRGGIEIEIRHTHVSLGNDLCNILRVRSKTLVRTASVSNFMENAWAQTFWVASWFVLGLGVASIGTAKVSGFIFSDINDMTDVIRSGGLTTSLVLSSFLTLACAIGSLVIGFASASDLAKQPESIIITSELHESQLAASDLKFKRRWIVVGFSLAATISVGVTTSLIATGLWERFFG